MDLKYLVKEARYYKKLNGFNRAFKKFIFSQTFLKKLVNKPLFNKFYSRIIKKKSKEISPTILQIENTNLCNARCIMCPHSIMKRKGKVMSFEEFKKIIDQVMKVYPIKIITITGFGEPFIDIGLMDKIEYINKKYPAIKIDLYTNGSLITKKITEELLKRKIWKITFSINGTKNSYKKIVGLNYSNTENKVLHFLKEKLISSSQMLTNVSAMLLKDNQREVKKFMEFWGEYSDSVRVYAPSNWAGALGNRNLVKLNTFKKKRWPCHFLWDKIAISAEGDVIVCCRDYESVSRFGNVFRKNIKQIFEGEKMSKLRKDHLNFKFNNPVCGKCDNSADSSLDWIL